MFDKIVEPTLVIDKKKCLSNISRMAAKAADHKLAFRPHFKTHQSVETGSWYRRFGITKITVSSLSMARQFSEAGWKDITVAFPLNPREIERINNIDPDVELNLTAENTDSIDLIKFKLGRPVNIFIKIDTGYNRTGIWFDNFPQINKIIETVNKEKLMTFVGFIIHAGHSYNCNSEDEVLKIHSDSLKKINFLKSYYISRFPELIISYGDTPTCSLANDFQGIDEIRPGNFVYFDLSQEKIGSCTIDDIAVAVACPVVAKHPSRNQVVIYGGAVHLSKDFLTYNGRNIWGVAAIPAEDSWKLTDKETHVISVSQEHGILESGKSELFSKIRIGDIIMILPVHSCLTANLLKSQLII